MLHPASFIITHSALSQLRTKEQLGYIVWTRSHYSPSFQYYLSCIVQSSHKGPEFLDARIEAFLLQVRKVLLCCCTACTAVLLSCCLSFLFVFLVCVGLCSFWLLR